MGAVDIYGYATDDTGVTDEASGIQDAIDAATTAGKPLDLGFGSWRFNSQLTLTCPIQNGELVASIPDTSGNKESNTCIVAEPASGESYARTEIRNVTIRRMQYANKVALRIDRGLRVLLRDVWFENWRNGSCQPLWLRGVQLGRFDRVVVDGYGIAALEAGGMSGYTATTDCLFTGCTFKDGLNGGKPMIDLPLFGSQCGTAGMTFLGCEFTNTYGEVVKADATRRLRLYGCRFENLADTYHPIDLANSISDSNCRATRIDGCSFSAGDGTTAIVRVGSNVKDTVISYNMFPSGTPNVSDGGTGTVQV